LTKRRGCDSPTSVLSTPTTTEAAAVVAIHFDGAVIVSPALSVLHLKNRQHGGGHARLVRTEPSIQQRH